MRYPSTVGRDECCRLNQVGIFFNLERHMLSIAQRG